MLPVPVVLVTGVPVVDIVMLKDLPLTSRVPSARMRICTVIATLTLPKGPTRVNVSVPLTAAPPAVTLLAVIWIVQGSNLTDFPASGPCVKVKVQDPKVVLPLDVEPPLVKLNVVGLVKVSVAGLFPRLGSKIEPF